MKTRSILFALSALLALMVGVVVGRGDAASLAAPASAGLPKAGTPCEVVLRADVLGDRGDWVTPQDTRENVNGSKRSVWGTFQSATDDWLVIEVTPIKVERGDGGSATFGTAGEGARQTFHVPRASVAYVRAFPRP